MKKKLLAILLSITMVVTLTPAISFAESDLPSEAKSISDETEVSDASDKANEDGAKEEAKDGEKAKSAIKPMAEDDYEDEYDDYDESVIISGSCGENVTYELTSDGTLIISGSGDMTYDDEDDYYSLAPWHENCESIKAVIIESGVTSIGDSAFEYCESLKSISIPDSVEKIGDYAFYNCSRLASITIPDSVESIGKYAFFDCESLKSISIPDSVEKIGDYAFFYCSSLASITISDGVTSIGDGAFEDCESLKSISIPDSVTSIGDSAFYECESLKSITIPDSVTSIGDYAFSWCDLKAVFIPKSVEKIGERAFEGQGYGEKDSCKFYCENASEPAGWAADWYDYNVNKVIFSYSREAYSKKLNSLSATLSTTTYTYNGSPKKPSVTVKNGFGAVLTNGTDYIVKYPSSRTNPGTYKVTITAKGCYSGTITKTFKINPKAVTQLTPAKASKAFTAKWKKSTSANASGYQVRYSTKSSMSKAKIKTVSGYSKTSLKVSNLSKKKKYYVQVRAYKSVSGTKYYSSWSSKKSVTTK